MATAQQKQITNISNRNTTRPMAPGMVAWRIIPTNNRRVHRTSVTRRRSTMVHNTTRIPTTNPRGIRVRHRIMTRKATMTRMGTRMARRIMGHTMRVGMTTLQGRPCSQARCIDPVTLSLPTCVNSPSLISLCLSSSYLHGLHLHYYSLNASVHHSLKARTSSVYQRVLL